MTKTTACISEFKPEFKSGTSLAFELCKGGYFSTSDEYGLKVSGKTKQSSTPKYDSPVPIQCVKAGTRIICGNEITVPCDLYEGDIWYPASGRVEKRNRVLILNGTENVNVGDNNSRSYQWLIGKNAIANNKSDLCTIAAYQFGQAKNGFYLNDWSSSIGSGHTLNFGWGFAPDIKGKTAWQAYIKGLYDSGNPVTVVHKLATPVVAQYEPQRLFSATGSAEILQNAAELNADLSATMLINKAKKPQI